MEVSPQDHEPSDPSSQPPSHPTSKALDGIRVLIVEDDAPSAKLVAVILEDEGCATRIVASAEAALENLAVWAPDLIVLDLVLPMMSGLVLSSLLRTRPVTARIPIIAVSAFNGPEAERLALEAGCSAYIRKPIDALSFASLVIAHLGNRR